MIVNWRKFKDQIKIYKNKSINQILLKNRNIIVQKTNPKYKINNKCLLKLLKSLKLHNIIEGLKCKRKLIQNITVKKVKTITQHRK